jgi:hypothetical protein
MKKNLPYFLVIVALIFLIIAVLSSGKESPQSSMAPVEEDFESAELLETEILDEFDEQDLLYSLAAQETAVEAAEGPMQVEEVLPPPVPPARETAEKIFNIYTDKRAPDNHYAPSGWMGDFADVKLNDQSMVNPHSGSTCIQVVYSSKSTQGNGWAGVYWQNPPNNWGEKMGGFNLTGYNKLTFWARGENGGEAIEKFKIGGIKGNYPDSLEVEMGPVILTREWKKYTINLVGQDLSYVNGGLCWVTASRLNPDGATFYLDDIRFEYEAGLQANSEGAESMPFDVYVERNSVSNHFIASGWMGDYADLKIDEDWMADPYSGTTCIRVVYSDAASQGARWTGVFWQNPPNNWGQIKDAGYNLSRAGKLTFWARGEKGGERIEEFKLGGISGDYPDSDIAGIGPVVLTPEWKQYTIDLRGKDLSYIIGGFCFATNIDVNPEGCVFYLDDIRYE